MKIVSIKKANGSHRWLNLDQIVEVNFLKDKKRVRVELSNSSQVCLIEVKHGISGSHGRS